MGVRSLWWRLLGDRGGGAHGPGPGPHAHAELWWGFFDLVLRRAACPTFVPRSLEVAFRHRPESSAEPSRNGALMLFCFAFSPFSSWPVLCESVMRKIWPSLWPGTAQWSL